MGVDGAMPSAMLPTSRFPVNPLVTLMSQVLMARASTAVSSTCFIIHVYKKRDAGDSDSRLVIAPSRCSSIGTAWPVGWRCPLQRSSRCNEHSAPLGDLRLLRADLSRPRTLTFGPRVSSPVFVARPYCTHPGEFSFSAARAAVAALRQAATLLCLSLIHI